MSFLSGLFGGGGTKPPPVHGYDAGGLNVSKFGNVNPSSDRTGLVSSVSDLYGKEAGVYGGLANTVTPGFNDLLKSRLNEYNNSATAAIGDLRQNLGARRVLGSSFGQDTLSRANATFAQGKDAIVADNFLKSLATTQQLTQSQYTAARGQFQSALDELKLEANAGASMNSKANQILSQNYQTQAQLDAKAAAGAGSFFGQLAQPIISPITSALGKGVSSLFGGGAGDPATA